jgi:hypothetical protein
MKIPLLKGEHGHSAFSENEGWGCEFESGVMKLRAEEVLLPEYRKAL